MIAFMIVQTFEQLFRIKRITVVVIINRHNFLSINNRSLFHTVNLNQLEIENQVKDNKTLLNTAHYQEIKANLYTRRTH